MGTRTIKLIFAALCFLLAALPCAYCVDLSRSYSISSPQTVQRLTYTREKPSLQISAPAGWYMATAVVDSVVDRAIFFKNDPKKVLSQGHIPMPNIRISFSDNPRGLPAFFMTSEFARQIKEQGGSILLEPQELTVDKVLGSHFTSLEPRQNVVMDLFVFRRHNMYVAVMAVCDYAEFKGLQKSVKQAVDSIKFQY